MEILSESGQLLGQPRRCGNIGHGERAEQRGGAGSDPARVANDIVSLLCCA